MTDEEINEEPEMVPVLGDVMDFRLGQGNEQQRWIVLYPEDYDNFARDTEGNIAVLTDHEQAGELLSLAAETIAKLSPRDAEGDDVIRDMIAALEQQVEADDE